MLKQTRGEEAEEENQRRSSARSQYHPCRDNNADPSAPSGRQSHRRAEQIILRFPRSRRLSPGPYTTFPFRSIHAAGAYTFQFDVSTGDVGQFTVFGATNGSG